MCMGYELWCWWGYGVDGSSVTAFITSPLVLTFVYGTQGSNGSNGRPYSDSAGGPGSGGGYSTVSMNGSIIIESQGGNGGGGGGAGLGAQGGSNGGGYTGLGSNFATSACSNINIASNSYSSSSGITIVILATTAPLFTLQNVLPSSISNQDIQLTGSIYNSVQIQYNILLNGIQLYPISGYTTLANSPFNINYMIPNNLFNVGTNTITIQMNSDLNYTNSYISSTITKPLLSLYLIKDNNNIIYTFNGTVIVHSPSQILDDNNFINNGFLNPLLISSTMWNNVFPNKNGQMLYWTNDYTKSNYKILYNSNMSRPIDKLSDNFQILMYEN